MLRPIQASWQRAPWRHRPTTLGSTPSRPDLDHAGTARDKEEKVQYQDSTAKDEIAKDNSRQRRIEEERQRGVRKVRKRPFSRDGQATATGPAEHLQGH